MDRESSVSRALYPVGNKEACGCERETGERRESRDNGYYLSRTPYPRAAAAERARRDVA